MSGTQIQHFGHSKTSETLVVHPFSRICTPFNDDRRWCHGNSCVRDEDFATNETPNSGYVLSNGTKWRALPHDLPHWKTVYGYFRKWRKAGQWQQWYTTLRARLRMRLGRKATASAAILDSQSIKTSEGGNDKGYDVHKCCSGRKRHILVDTLGLLLQVLVTGAGVQDRDGAKQLLSSFYPAFLQSRLKHIWADAGYRGELIAWTLEIVRREKEQVGFAVLPKRWIVERTFAWFIRNRRLARDFERLPETSEAFIYVAMIRLMTRRLAKF